MSKTKTSSSLVDEFAQFEKANPYSHGPQCGVCKLPADIRKLVDDLCAAGKMRSRIAQFLKQKGHNVGSNSVRTHARNHVG